jgi:hypothetical protein
MAKTKAVEHIEALETVNVCIDGRGIRTRKFRRGEQYTAQDENESAAFARMIQEKWAKALSAAPENKMLAEPENKSKGA